MMPEELYRRSVEIILENQHAGGGFIASPAFPTYHYCWFRDGAFIAYAMDRAGERASAEGFHRWAARNILARKQAVAEGIEGKRRGMAPRADQLLHTRYTLEGKEGEVFWENFQLDGIGTWLWALGEHLSLAGRTVSPGEREAAALALDYLEAHWESPCYDCWEEFREEIHIHTLAALYGGVKAAGKLLARNTRPLEEAIRLRVVGKGIHHGALRKFEGSTLVDASLLGAALPYGLLDPADPVMEKTVRRIEEELCYAGGVHRYTEDTYYGGGIWLLLAAWLGLVYTRTDRRQEAEQILAWLTEQADEEGFLPEQTAGHLWNPAYLPRWEEKWGPSASPSSGAMPCISGCSWKSTGEGAPSSYKKGPSEILLRRPPICRIFDISTPSSEPWPSCPLGRRCG